MVLIDHTLTVNRIVIVLARFLTLEWKKPASDAAGVSARTQMRYGPVMELVDLTDSKSVASACGFESHLGHH